MTLKEKAYQQLKKLLLAREIKPGEFLSERTLVERLEMSRTPIRSALERLEVEGFIKQSPMQGIIVTEISLKDMIDIYELRKSLESYTVRVLSTRHLLEEHIAWFEQNLNEQKEFVEQKNNIAFTEKDTDFHNQLARILDNQEVIRIMEQIQDRFSLTALSVFNKDVERIQVSYEDHKTIFQYILRHEGESAASKMLQHLDYGKQILIS